MWKLEKRASETQAVKEEESAETKSNIKGRLLTPRSSSSAPRRFSKRLLEAKLLQSSIPELVTPSTENSPTTKKETTTSQVVTQVPLPPKTTFLAYSRRKSTRTHDMISPPCKAKKGKFLEEKNNNENETLEDNFRPCNIQQTQVDANIPCNIQQTQVDANIEVFENESSGEVMGLTEMANAAEKHSHENSDDEIVSSAGHAIYGVKKEFNSLVEKIFEKHGDIAKNHSLTSNMLCSFFLETVCVIFKKLQESTFEKIKKEELDFMLHQLVPIEANGIQVGWLCEKLNNIKEAKILYGSSSKIKDKREKVKREMGKFMTEMLRDQCLLREKEEQLKKYEGKMEELREKKVTVQGEMEPMRKKLSLSGKRLAELKTESKEIDASALDTMKKVHSVFRRSLIDGLL